MTGDIMSVGRPEIFKYSVGEVLDHASASRASVVREINYATGRMYVEPFTPGVPSLFRRIWLRLRYGYRFPA